MPPNPSFEARPNIKTPGPLNGLALFSIVRAWGFAAGPASTRTLGVTTEPCAFPHIATQASGKQAAHKSTVGEPLVCSLLQTIVTALTDGASTDCDDSGYP